MLEYSFVIGHRPGSQYVAAEALFWLSLVVRIVLMLKQYHD